MIVGIAGFARVGKTSIANELMHQLGGHVASFACELKRRIDPLFPADADKNVKRETYVAYGRAMRAIDPNYWIKHVRVPPHAGNIYLDDVRYVNEVKWIESLGGAVFLIHRDGIGPANDEERESFAAMPILPIINNDLTVWDATKAIIERLGESENV